MKNSVGIFLLCLLLIGCKKDEKKAANYYRGTTTLSVDPSFSSVSHALADAYAITYPEAKIAVKETKEDLALLDLLNRKTNIAVLSRSLSDAEKAAYKQQFNQEVVPAKFAADAVVFIVPVSSALSEISVEDIKNGLFSDEKKFVFDATNSSNLNFVAEKFHKKPSELKFSVLNGNQNVVKKIADFPGKIGVISLNTISREYNAENSELRKNIKILQVTENGKSYLPDMPNLHAMTYPFTRVLYFITNEAGFGIANGFIRYSCTQLGQMVVEKDGLQPYNIFKREVRFSAQ